MASLNDVSGLTGQSRASFINLLKVEYAQLWDDQAHKGGSVVAQRCMAKKGTMGGERTQAAVVTGYPQSVAISAREGVRLPPAEVGTYIKPELHARDLYTTLQWTGQAERSARKGDSVAFAKPRERDLSDARKQFDIEMAIKMILGFMEVRGKIAAGGIAGTVLTLEGRNTRNATDFWNSGRHFLRVNKHIITAATAAGAPRLNTEVFSGVESTNSRKIASVGGTNAAPTVTLADSAFPAGPAAGDYIIPAKSRANINNPPWTGTAADEITAFASFNGLFNIAVDSNVCAAIYGLAKSSNPTLSGRYFSNPTGAGTTRPFEERLVNLMVDSIRDDGTGNEPDFLYLHPATRREVIAEHSDQRRYGPVVGASGYEQLVAHVGDKALKYESDYLMMPGMVAGLRTDPWGWIEQSPLSPIDMQTERYVEGYDAHTINWHKSGNIECQVPNDQGIMDDIDFDAFDING